jgi:hypothetical protein
MSDLRELRAILVRVPPLLADLIRRLAGARLGPLGIRFSIIAEFDDFDVAVGEFGRLVPHVVIVGRVVAPPPQHALARVLGLSADLTRIFGPGADEDAALTQESLARKLIEVAETAKPLLY